jgi:AraC-like DNA-binding protein
LYKFNTTLEPLWVTRSHFEKNIEVKGHTHEHYYHMIYVISGSFEFTINGKPYALGQNMLTIAKPGDIQSWINTHDQPVDTYEVKFTVFDSFLKDALNRLPDVVFGNLFIKTLFEKIAEEKKQTNKYYQEYISIYLNTILYDMVRLEMATIVEENKNGSKRNPVDIVIHYIQENYGKDLSLENIAEATYFNKSYLSTIFKKNEGLTVNDFIYKFRTYKACELIAYSDLQLSQVSTMVGFKHVQHFSRMFKKYIGLPPGEYRSATPKAFIHYDETEHKFNVEVLPVRSGRLYEVDSDTGFYRDKESDK